MRILFFTQLKDVTQCAELSVSWGRVDVEGLWQKLLALQPGLERYRASVRLARNSEYVGPDAVFTDADEVALIPPVSGG